MVVFLKSSKGTRKMKGNSWALWLIAFAMVILCATVFVCAAATVGYVAYQRYEDQKAFDKLRHSGYFQY